jgi:predicted HNH restriction endonuclease
MAQASKGKLPFVVQPKAEKFIDVIGTEESGKIEIERRGYLTVSEKAIVQGSISGDPTMSDLYRLGSKIAKEKKKKAGNVVKDMMQAERPAYMADYEGEITDRLMALIAFQEKLTIVQATAVLMSRVDANWTVEQTFELHPDLVQSLAEFYSQEESRSVSRAVSEKVGEQGGGVVEGK